MRTRVMGVHRLLILTGVLVVCPQSLWAEDTLESVEKKIVEAWDKHRAMTAKYTRSTEDDSRPGMFATLSEIGTFEYMRKDGKSYLRVELNAHFESHREDGRVRATDRKILRIYDGESTHELVEQGQEKMAFKVRPNEQRLYAGGRETFAAMKVGTKLKLASEQKVNDAACYVIELVPNEPAKTLHKKMEFCFRQADGVLVRVRGFNADGKPTMLTQLTEVKIDPELKPERFEFKLPEGVKLIDQMNPAKSP